jgi:hypothetical protein
MLIGIYSFNRIFAPDNSRHTSFLSSSEASRANSISTIVAFDDHAPHSTTCSIKVSLGRLRMSAGILWNPTVEHIVENTCNIESKYCIEALPTVSRSKNDLPPSIS